MKVEIITIGTEIIIGDITDTNSQYISKCLVSIGCDVYHHHSVGDNRERLKEVFEIAFNRSDLVVICGGLGPTKDDLTKDTIFSQLKLKAILNDNAYENIKEYFNNIGREVENGSENQAMIPKGVKTFPNDVGTAVGCFLSVEDKSIMMLPGPPSENRLMLERYIMPYLKSKSSSVIISKPFKVINRTEMYVEQMVGNLIEGKNPTVGIYAKPGYVEVRVTAKAKSKQIADYRIEKVASEIEKVLGPDIFNDNGKSFEEQTVENMIKKGLKLSICESCTGGMMSSMITDISGSSKVLPFSQITYEDEMKIRFAGVNKKSIEKNGAVSLETAGQMAIGTMLKTETDIGVAITGVAGPKGIKNGSNIGTVFVAVCDSETLYIKKFNFGTISREDIKKRAVIAAFSMLHLFINDSEIQKAKQFEVKEWMKMVKVRDNSRRQNQGNNKMSKKAKILYTTIRTICFLIISISLWELAKYGYESFINSRNNSELSNAFANGKEGNVTMPSDYLKDFSYLYSINQDVKGYIKLPNTNIDFPIVQTNDNYTYLYKDFYNKKSRYGTIFFDFRNNIKDTNKNLIIYGHNMNDGQMFTKLLDYRYIDFYKKHPTMEISTVYEKAEYDVFAAFMANANPNQGDVFNYNNKINFKSDDDFTTFIKEVKKRSYITTNVDIKPTDHIITLSTCDDVDFKDSRFVVMARKRTSNHEALDVENAQPTNNPQMPEEWYRVKGITPPSNLTASLNEWHNSGFSSNIEDSLSFLNYDTIIEATDGIESKNENNNQITVEQGNTDNSNNIPSINQNIPVGGNNGVIQPPVINPPQNNLPSTNINQTVFTFTTYGYGHGVGMSQYGANLYAKSGWGHERILKHYYTGVTLEDKGYATGTTLKVSASGKYKEGDISYILAGVINAEMGPHFQREALLAQAIATHTFVKEKNLAGTVPYVPFSEPSSDMINLCKTIENKLITYNGNVVYTPYFAMSSGYTQSSKDMWGGSFPWLSPVDSSLDKTVTNPPYYMNYKNELKITASDLKSRIQSTFKITLSDNPSNWFKNIVKNSSGYVTAINIDDKITVRGRDIREKVFTTTTFKSHAFDVSLSS